jgi:hypothetical protein
VKGLDYEADVSPVSSAKIHGTLLILRYTLLWWGIIILREKIVTPIVNE